MLTPRFRRRVPLLIGLMVVGAAAESLSVGLLMPLLATLSGSNMFEDLPGVQRFLASLGASTPASIAMLIFAAIVVAFTMKACLAVGVAYAESAFAFSVQRDISQRLFSGYVRQSWLFHVGRNSSELIRNVTIEPQYVSLLIIASLHIVSECLVLCALLMLCVIVEPLAAIVAFVALACAAWSFYRVSQGRVRRWGQSRLDREGRRLMTVQQALGAIKEVILAGRESSCEAQYAHHNQFIVHALKRQQFMLQLPRIWLEWTAVVGAIAVMAVIVIKDGDAGTAIPLLGLFAAAAFKALPSLNRLINALHVVRFRLPSLRTVSVELSSNSEASRSISALGTSGPLEGISLEGVCYRYPASDHDVLSDVSIYIRKGTTVGVMGASGAGKSTLIDVILGLLSPIGGVVKVNGVDIQNDLRGWHRRIGYVPQSIFLLDDTIRCNVAFGLPDREIDDNEVQRALVSAGLGDLIEQLERGIHTRVGERGVRLSGGQRQRIGIARALYRDPEVLVLDEATSALDGGTEEAVMHAVSEFRGHKTVIIIAHRLSTIDRCDVLFRVGQGQVELLRGSAACG